MLFKILYLIFIISFLFINCSHKKESGNDLGNSKDRSNKLIKLSTTFQEKVQEDILITTEDSKSLSAYLFYTKEKKENSQPLVILIHQFKQSKEQWPDEFIDSLLNNNYKVFLYDIRGHGNSSKVNYE
ncbi:MAG: alpha/beta hydrolase family protein, partial [Ignavibacteria bacterium]